MTGAGRGLESCVFHWVDSYLNGNGVQVIEAVTSSGKRMQAAFLMLNVLVALFLKVKRNGKLILITDLINPIHPKYYHLDV